MKKGLLQYLICPLCRQNFQTKNIVHHNDEITNGFLVCPRRHRFPISDGIPRLVSDTESGFVETERAFSSKWRNYNKSLHNKKWYNFQKKWFLQRFGWKNVSNFNKFLNTTRYILDAGTGLGNSAKLFSANSDSDVFAIDASNSIDFAYRKYGKERNIHFIQADLRQLPFRKSFFDFICSDQVLHHTDNTQKAFRYLTQFLKRRGLISIYVYNKKAPLREFADDFIRARTTKMSVKECIKFSKEITNLGKSFASIRKRITITKDIPLLKIRAGTYDIQRFIFYNFLKCYWCDDGSYERSVGVNFDWYYPKYAHRHTSNEVRDWFRKLKLKLVHFREIESGISATGKR